MPAISATVKGLKQFQRGLKAESGRQEKALQTAVKVEGFRLMRLLKKEISQGHPGGRSFAPLSEIGARTKAGRLQGRGEIKKFGQVGLARAPKRKALRRLSVAVRYLAKRDPFSFRFGWVGPKISKSWKRLAGMHQEGFTEPVSEGLRVSLRGTGASIAKGRPYRKFFFLRKSTTALRTPARPILEPFWRAYQDDAWRNIRKNFKRKLAGERI